MESEQPDEVVPGFKSVEEFIKSGFKMLVEATKEGNAIPSGSDWNFYETHDSFRHIMKEEGDRLLGLINALLRKNGIQENIRNRSLSDKMELIVEANDCILERVANNIDIMNGIKKATQEPIEIQAVSAQLPISGSWNLMNKATFSVSSSLQTPEKENDKLVKSFRLITAKNILRPQKFFKDKIDNSNSNPWMPRITEKPNSIKPLALYIEETEQGQIYSHPYELELERFTPSESQLRETVPRFPKELDEVPLFNVDTPEKLNKLVEELRTFSEIAVDLEHHSYRSFLGITCLMQISTEKADYLIDTIALRDQLWILNEVFTKPTIVKVFHGADHDIEWLQRDLSLYVVNMFDTHQAAKFLDYPGVSLAYLLQKFCSVTPNKHFQLADWRIRPLPDELKKYARMDTHYLIYIYHKLKNELLQKGNKKRHLLVSVIGQSTEVCKRRFVKPVHKENSHLEFYRKCKRLFDNRQMFALKELYSWRDAISRQEDESTGYVLPNHMLLQISEKLPREMQGVLACCNPIPPLVRANLLDLHKIILRAREQPLVKPILKENSRSRGSTQEHVKVNISSLLHCPHDLTKAHEIRDNLPTLLGSGGPQFRISDGQNIKIEKLNSIFSVFDSPETFSKRPKAKEKLKFLSPYERYKLVKAYVCAEEEAVAAAALKAEQEHSKPQVEVSDEDRIAALHDHFVKVSKEVPQKQKEEIIDIENHNKEENKKPTKRKQQSLVDLGGTKKKKPTTMAGSSKDVPAIPDFSTPIPKFEQNFNKSNTDQSNKKTNHGKEIQKEKYKFEKEKLKKETMKKLRQVKINESKSFKPFDYSSVDFRLFQGGAARNPPSKPHQKFKYWNKRKYGGKHNNKSGMFTVTQNSNKKHQM